MKKYKCQYKFITNIELFLLNNMQVDIKKIKIKIKL